MKQGFQVLGIITLLVGSFWYSKEVDTVAKLSDDLLEEIKVQAPSYKKEVILPVITKDTIIPGLNGREVDINESYQKMREIGYYDAKMLQYRKIKISDVLSKHQDKYIISGNGHKYSIALIFKVNNYYNLNKIIKVLDKEKVKGAFFIRSDFLKNNYILIWNLIKKGHTIGILNKDDDSDFTWASSVILSAGQKNNYCYTEKKNKNILDKCFKTKSYTIIPTAIIQERPYSEIKKVLQKGALISLETNEKLNNQLQVIINYIKSKGYKIISLEKELQE